MSMRKTTLAPGQLLRSVHMEKVTSARRVTRCCTTGNPPLEVAPGQRKIHVNSYRRQTVHRGKVDPGVSELPRGNELSRDHVNRPLDSELVYFCDLLSLILTHSFHLWPVKIFALDMGKLMNPVESDKKFTFALFTFEVQIFQLLQSFHAAKSIRLLSQVM